MLKLPSPNVAAETHTVYLSYKGVYCPSWQLVIQAHASWVSKKLSCMKILLTVRMPPAAIALNYSVVNIQNDVRQKKIIYEKLQFNSLVWGSLTLAPIICTPPVSWNIYIL